MGLRVAFLAAECEPWAKTGGLADVVDALARALGHPNVDGVDGPVDVFLPRYRGVPDPDPAAILGTTTIGVPDPRAPDGRLGGHDRRRRRRTAIDCGSSITRRRSIGTASTATATGDYADNAWRFGLFCRAALEALRADGRPLDVLHLHDWQAGPAAIFRDALVRGRPGRRAGRAGHDAPQPRLPRLDAERRRCPSSGLRPGDGGPGQNADGVDLLAAGIERSRAREHGLAGLCRARR